MYKMDKETKIVIDLRWYKSLGDDKFNLEKLVRTTTYIFNDDPNCPKDLRIVESYEDDWEHVPYIVGDCYREI